MFATEPHNNQPGLPGQTSEMFRKRALVQTQTPGSEVHPESGEGLYGDSTPIMENRMEKNMEHEMETGFM